MDRLKSEFKKELIKIVNDLDKLKSKLIELYTSLPDDLKTLDAPVDPPPVTPPGKPGQPGGG